MKVSVGWGVLRRLNPGLYWRGKTQQYAYLHTVYPTVKDAARACFAASYEEAKRPVERYRFVVRELFMDIPGD